MEKPPPTPLPKIGNPATRALAAAGCFALEDVARFSENEVRSWHGVGPYAVNKIRQAFQEKGLKFKSE